MLILHLHGTDFPVSVPNFLFPLLLQQKWVPENYERIMLSHLNLLLLEKMYDSDTVKKPKHINRGFDGRFLTFLLQTVLCELQFFFYPTFYKQCYLSYAHVHLQWHRSFAKSPISFLVKGNYIKVELGSCIALVIVLASLFPSIGKAKCIYFTFRLWHCTIILKQYNFWDYLTWPKTCFFYLLSST